MRLIKPYRSFHRFAYYSIPLLAIAVFIPFAGTGTAPGAGGLRWAAYAVMGVAGVGLAGYGLLRGQEWLKGMLLSLMSFVIFYGLLEGVCGLVLRWRTGAPAVASPDGAANKKTGAQTPKDLRLIRDERFGTFWPAPGQYETVYPVRSGANAGRPVAVTYAIDSLSRRITPFAGDRAGRYALFLGCSFTFGEAVADTNTLPYFFGKETHFRPYNYGVSGQSPTNMLTLLQTRNLRRNIAETDGVAIYTYIGDHLARAAPSTFWAHNANGFLPYVNPESGVVESSYARKHPIRMQLIRWMYQSNIINLFKISFPKRYRAEHYQRFVNVVSKTRELYRKQFGNDHFYVVIFPEYPMDAELRQRFEEAHLRVLDYSRLLKWETAYDGQHPDGRAYQRVARRLARDVVGPLGQPLARVR